MLRGVSKSVRHYTVRSLSSIQSIAVFECFPFAKQFLQQTVSMAAQITVCSLPPLTPNNLRVLCPNAEASFGFCSVCNPLGCVPLTDYNPLAPEISRISTTLVRFLYNVVYKNTLFSDVVLLALINTDVSE